MKFQSPQPLPRWEGVQRRIGLTGGIASGKSSIGRFLQQIKGLEILDADDFARQALRPGEKATMQVIERYGSSVVTEPKAYPAEINRQSLSKIIFANQDEKQWLEDLVHPIIKQRIIEELVLKQDLPTIVLIIPLLFEAKLTEICSEFWVVTCKQEQQMKRLMKRDDLSLEDAAMRINAQWSLSEKEKAADIVIDNSGEPKAWVDKINALI